MNIVYVFYVICCKYLYLSVICTHNCCKTVFCTLLIHQFFCMLCAFLVLIWFNSVLDSCVFRVSIMKITVCLCEVIGSIGNYRSYKLVLIQKLYLIYIRTLVRKCNILLLIFKGKIA